MSDCFCEINLADIDLTDERYKISFLEKDIDFLAQSLKQTGLICPPAVRPLNNKFIIISGFNRIRAMIHNKETKILVYKINPETTEYECLLKSITAIAFQRQLTQAELIICATRLSSFLNIEDMAKKSPAIFNIQLGARFIGDLLTLGGLPDPALKLIHKGNLSFKAAKRICLFEKETINEFLNIFSRIHASQNKQLEIILHVMEITKRDSIKPEKFLNNHKINDILLDEKKEPGLKTNLFRAYLFEKRFPAVFKMRQKTLEKISSVKFGNNIKFLPPENFDSQNYSISFNAKNYQEFLTNVEKLNSSLENKKLKEIFNQ